MLQINAIILAELQTAHLTGTGQNMMPAEEPHSINLCFSIRELFYKGFYSILYWYILLIFLYGRRGSLFQVTPVPKVITTFSYKA